MKKVRFFVFLAFLMVFLSSCTVFKDLFLNVNKIGQEFVTAFDLMVKNVPAAVVGAKSVEFELPQGRVSPIDPAVGIFMDKYVHLATGITKSTEGYYGLEEALQIMGTLCVDAVFISAEKFDIPPVLAGERFFSPVLCGSPPTYVAKGILVKMKVGISKPGWACEEILVWPLLLIEDKPFMFTVYRATMPVDDEYLPFYPIPFVYLLSANAEK